MTAGQIVLSYYDAAISGDFAKARTFLADDLVFVGLFDTYRSADEYLNTFSGLLGITTRLDVKTIIAQGDEAALFFELETTPPAEGTVVVAEWHSIRNGKIARVESVFDGRPFAAMFAQPQT